MLPSLTDLSIALSMLAASFLMPASSSANGCVAAPLTASTVGWMTLARDAEGLDLDQIYLAPEHQGKGVGTILVRDIICQAASAGPPLRLSTAKINPARRLYERLGFFVVREDEYKVYMEVRGEERP
jgi:GNAT superfamily N-acetyltransferase